jgi:regulator of replication initiation timing
MNQAVFLTILDQLQQTEEGKKVIRANMAHIKKALASYTPQEQALIIRNGNLSLEIQTQTEHKQRESELKRNVAAAQELAQLHDALLGLNAQLT